MRPNQNSKEQKDLKGKVLLVYNVYLEMDINDLPEDLDIMQVQKNAQKLIEVGYSPKKAIEYAVAWSTLFEDQL